MTSDDKGRSDRQADRNRDRNRGGNAKGHMTRMGKQRELRTHWQRIAKLILAKDGFESRMMIYTGRRNR
jgi:hypothetical protein